MKSFHALAIALAETCVIAIAACSTSEIATVTTATQQLVADACLGAQAAAADAKLAVKGGAANTVANLAAYVAGTCDKAEVIAKVAADPTTTAWLGDIKGQLETLASVAKGTTPTPIAAVPAAASP